MTDQTPSLQLSDTDGIGPVKRRRPALSCVECRRRKVKCDREKPCGPCSRTKSSTCTYRPNPQRTKQSRQPAQTFTSSSSSHDHESQSSPKSYAHTFDSLVNRYIAPGIFGSHGGVSGSHLPIYDNDSDQLHSDLTIKSLIEKVRELEQKLTSVANGNSPGLFTLPARPAASIAPGQFVKSKFYGESHWMNSIEPYEALGPNYATSNPITNKTDINKSSELYFTVNECKRMARTIKSSRHYQAPISAEVGSSVPSKQICDQLVHCYLRTFESVYRILHIPTFWREYERFWENSNKASPSFTIKFLLILAIGVPFSQSDTQLSLHIACGKWVQAAESYLSAPHEKSRLNLTGIQIHILLLLARQVCSVEGDLIWIPAGALLRSAMHIGLHRDPSNFPKISVFYTEMRRRLWAAVLEVTVQSSLDMGMPPMLSLQDYDTLPPSNINDDELSEDTTEIDPKSPTTFTQSSIQIILHKSLPLRLEITRLINNLRTDLSYDETLRLGSEINSMCRSNLQLCQSFLLSESHPAPFQMKMLDVLTRRFLLCLHRPFFAKAKTNPKYYYSRKICLDTSLMILSPAYFPLNQDFGSEGPVQKDDWTRLTVHSVGFFKSIFLYSTTTVYLELLSQLEEQQQDSANSLPFHPSPFSTSTSLFNFDRTSIDTSTLSTPATSDILTTAFQYASSSQPIKPPPHFDTLRAVLVAALDTAEARIRAGETNPKGNVFFCCALARIDALVSGQDSDAAVLDAAKKSVATCSKIMKESLAHQSGEATQTGREDGRSGLDGNVSGGGVEMVGGDVDWESLMEDESMGLEFGFDVPESWFFTGWHEMGKGVSV